MGLAACLGDAQAINGVTKKFKFFPAKKLESKAELQKRYAEKEAKVNWATVNQGTRVFPAKNSGGNNSVQTSVVYSSLGKSMNPFMSVTSGRNYVSANPALNSVALFRRGSIDEKPLAQGPGNELYFDLSKQGGAEGSWQVKRGQLWDNDPFGPVGAVNFGPRYPQGVLWSPPGSTDTSAAVALAVTRVLDGTNDNWGGLGKGWQKLGGAQTYKQTLWSSQTDPAPYFHFRQYGLDYTSSGAIFTVEPEEDLSSGDVLFTDKILVHKYLYNSALNSFDSTTTVITFANSGQDPATSVGDCQIAFGPDGQTGYVVIAGYNPDFSNIFAYTPYISSTTDGGNSWSDLKLYNINKSPEEFDYKSPDKDAFRNDLLGNYHIYNSDDTYYTSDSGSLANSHAVDYTIMDLDIAVDKNNYPHIFGILCVAGIGDTLAVTGPGFYRPGYGSWNFHMTIKPGTDSLKAIVVGQNASLQGCWGDCDTDDNIKEFNRPHISASADGSVIAMSWYDTDQDAHPQTRDENNSNPDLMVRAVKVQGPGEFYYTAQNKNFTQGSDYDGLAILGSVAPKLLNSVNGFTLASTTALLSDYDPGATNAVWPISHQFVGGVNIPSALDSFPVQISSRLMTSKTQNIAGNVNKGSEMSLLPNPSNGTFSAHLNVEKGGLAQIKVLNSIGQTVEASELMLGKGGVNIPLNFKNLKQGIYFLNIQVGGKVNTKRFVVE